MSADTGAELGSYALFLTRDPQQVRADLEAFTNLLHRWQRVQNLVSRETLDDVWHRHIRDSLQLLPLLGEGDTSFLDLGSGGGLPAIPLAIALKGRSNFTLVEPNHRKASFLRTVARELHLSLAVHAIRSEQITTGAIPTPDVVTSRALAALDVLLGLALPFCGPNTRLLLHKGRGYREELAKSRVLWHYDSTIHPSATEPEAVVLELTNLRQG